MRCEAAEQEYTPRHKDATYEYENVNSNATQEQLQQLRAQFVLPVRWLAVQSNE